MKFDKKLAKIVAVFLFGVIVGGGLVARYGSPIKIAGFSASANLQAPSCTDIRHWLNSNNPSNILWDTYIRWYDSLGCTANLPGNGVQKDD